MDQTNQLGLRCRDKDDDGDDSSEYDLNFLDKYCVGVFSPEPEHDGPGFWPYEKDFPNKPITWEIKDRASRAAYGSLPAPNHQETLSRITFSRKTDGSGVDSHDQHPLRPSKSPEPPSKILEESISKFSDCDALLGPSAVLSDAPELWVSNLLEKNRLTRQTLELNPHPNLDLVDGEPKPALDYHSLHKVLEEFQDKMDTPELETWNILRDVRSEYWEFMNKAQGFQNAQNDSRAYTVFLRGKKAELVQEKSALVSDDHAEVNSRLAEIDEQLRKRRASIAEMNKMMTRIKSKMRQLVAALSEAKIAALRFTIPGIIEAYHEVSDQEIDHQYLSNPITALPVAENGHDRVPVQDEEVRYEQRNTTCPQQSPTDTPVPSTSTIPRVRNYHTSKSQSTHHYDTGPFAALLPVQTGSTRSSGPVRQPLQAKASSRSTSSSVPIGQPSQPNAASTNIKYRKPIKRVLASQYVQPRQQLNVQAQQQLYTQQPTQLQRRLELKARLAYTNMAVYDPPPRNVHLPSFAEASSIPSRPASQTHEILPPVTHLHLQDVAGVPTYVPIRARRAPTTSDWQMPDSPGALNTIPLPAPVSTPVSALAFPSALASTQASRQAPTPASASAPALHGFKKAPKLVLRMPKKSSPSKEAAKPKRKRDASKAAKAGKRAAGAEATPGPGRPKRQK